MSATQEKLASELRIIEEQITSIKASGGDVSQLQEQRASLLKQLQVANDSLTEGSQILKG